MCELKFADCGGKGNIRNENPWKIETKLCDVIPKVYSSGCIDSVIQARNQLQLKSFDGIGIAGAALSPFSKIMNDLGEKKVRASYLMGVVCDFPDNKQKLIIFAVCVDLSCDQCSNSIATKKALVEQWLVTSN